ncbi:hypothetical protein BLNAU_19028 [Blattamonas nauphoetae]|uniref:Uncharacterized protein n=1 Tax=Blattamonas nauphoetae TaxID=2049346 RepID=A0ABQ9X508_9EUKA|nr:hypothetical protein BLNAU_19028 [Blattamonas nauphoetae]
MVPDHHHCHFKEVRLRRRNVSTLARAPLGTRYHCHSYVGKGHRQPNNENEVRLSSFECGVGESEGTHADTCWTRRSSRDTDSRSDNTTSEGIGVRDEVLYPFKTDTTRRGQKMKFKVLYKVTSLKATGRSNSVQVGSVGVQMPVEPVRLTKIEVDDETETSIRLVVTSSGFVTKETYTVEVSGVLTGSESEEAHTRTFTVLASGGTSASSSPLIHSDS